MLPENRKLKITIQNSAAHQQMKKTSHNYVRRWHGKCKAISMIQIHWFRNDFEMKRERWKSVTAVLNIWIASLHIANIMFSNSIKGWMIWLCVLHAFSMRAHLLSCTHFWYLIINCFFNIYMAKCARFSISSHHFDATEPKFCQHEKKQRKIQRADVYALKDKVDVKLIKTKNVIKAGCNWMVEFMISLDEWHRRINKKLPEWK